MAVESTRWGIIYCPKTHHTKRRDRLQALLDQRGIDYDFVQSETTNSVERLATMMINNGYKTLVIVGGDSALNDVVNCLMKEEQRVRDEITLGIIPGGVMNDFARFWGLDENRVEEAIDWIKQRKVRKIDLGCLRYTNAKGEHCHRYFLNCVNIGMIADIMNLRRQTRHIFGSRTLSFVASALLLMFHRMDYKMKLRVNTDEIDRKVMTVCVGNGPGYGQTPNAVPYNGMLDVSVVYTPELTGLATGLWLLFTNRFLNHRSVHPYRTRQVVVEQAPKALVGVDGRLLKTPVGSYKIEVEQEVINLIVN